MIPAGQGFARLYVWMDPSLKGAHNKCQYQTLSENYKTKLRGNKRKTRREPAERAQNQETDATWEE